MSKLIKGSKEDEITNFASVYSTKKHLVGFWEDGRKLYRQIINVNSGFVSGSNRVLLNNPKLYELIDIKGKLYRTDGYFIKFPQILYNGSNVHMQNWDAYFTNITNEVIPFFIGSSLVTVTKKVVIEIFFTEKL